MNWPEALPGAIRMGSIRQAYGNTSAQLVFCGPYAVQKVKILTTLIGAIRTASFAYLGNQCGTLCAKSEAQFHLLVAGNGHVIYLSGDTDIMADMEWMGDLHKPDIGILCAGGHYTMDMARAAYAAKRYFNFKTVIPCHYKTFPILAQSADELIKALPNVGVVEPEVLKPITI